MITREILVDLSLEAVLAELEKRDVTPEELIASGISSLWVLVAHPTISSDVIYQWICNTRDEADAVFLRAKYDYPLHHFYFQEVKLAVLDSPLANPD